MPVIKKVESKINNKSKDQDLAVKEEKLAEKGEVKEVGVQRTGRSKRVCVFCTTKTAPAYWDSLGLRKFVNDRGRIVARARTGTCAKHQRVLAKHIKYSRHLALLPFMVRV